MPTGVEQEDAERPGGMRFDWTREGDVTSVGVFVEVQAPLEVDSRSCVVVPDEERRRAEAAIVEYGDLLGVMLQCKRQFRSPDPCVAVTFTPEEVANGVVGLARSHDRFTKARVLRHSEKDPSIVERLVADRLDGIALLADSLAEDGAAARVRDLFRLFERAFALSPGRAIKPLTSFLASSPRRLGYTESEVASWLVSLRSKLSHADRRDDYARSHDADPFLGRIEYAAYDVLFNKAKWRDQSADRRDGLRFASAVDQSRTNSVVFERVRDGSY